MKRNFVLAVIIGCVFVFGNGCKKSTTTTPVIPTPPAALKINGIEINNKPVSFPDKIQYDIPLEMNLKLKFNKQVEKDTLKRYMYFTAYSNNVPFNLSYVNNDSSQVLITPVNSLEYLFPYEMGVFSSLKAKDGGAIDKRYDYAFSTKIDSSNKFPIVADSVLLDIVQQQTFRYFWDFGHPVSGLARERSNGDNETITSGGSGFGIMCIPVAIHRNFITRSEGLQRLQTIVSFLKNTAQRFHGAFPHWLNGTSGTVIPFSAKDNGADLVETSYLMAGLLTARQYFNGSDAVETTLRNDINTLYNDVEWDWFRNGGQNVLYWHWSPNYNWDMNMQIQGWNECLITYIMAASSSTHSIPQLVYTNGFARNGSMRNGTVYYNYNLPLGPAYGGPLFLSHYSFLGVNPNGLNDQFANYQTQVVNHTKINYEYCKANPKNFFGYSSVCWGLTASDIYNGYKANSPSDDDGYITPTAALSSFPYTPVESMAALKFFYYTMGHKLLGNYGLKDAFTLKFPAWFADSHLAIDQGPIIIMIENYRTGLIWDLFTSCPEIKNGMRSLGFTAPYL
jgi:hypothetical protein